MSLHSNRLIIQLAVLGSIAVALASCKQRKRWGVAYFEIEATPLEFPITEYKLKHPVAINSFKFSARRVERATVDEPNATPPPQRLAIVYSLGAKAGDGDNCTGFFISKRDFLTARHCVPKEAKDQEIEEIDVDLGTLGTQKAKCSRSPGPDTWQDWAICSFAIDLDLGDTFALTKCAPKPNTKIVIMGFCELAESGTSSSTIKPAKVPNAGVLEALAPEEGFLPATPPKGRTSACPLDSGGPAFIPEQLTQLGDQYTPSGKIRVFGIISAIGRCPPGQSGRTCIAPTTDQSFLSFLNDHKAGTATVLECDE